MSGYANSIPVGSNAVGGITWFGSAPVPLTPLSQQMLAQGYQPKSGNTSGGFINQKFGGLFSNKGPFAAKNAFGAGPMTRSENVSPMPMSGGGGQGHGGGWSAGYEHQKANTYDGRMHGYSYKLQSKPKESGLDWIENNGPMANMGQQMNSGSQPSTLTGTVAPYQGPLKDRGIETGGIQAGQPFRSNRDDEWFQATDGTGAPITQGSYTATKPGAVLTPSQMRTLASSQPGPKGQWDTLTPQQQMQLMNAGDISQEQQVAMDTLFPNKMGVKRDPVTGEWPRRERGYLDFQTHDLFKPNKYRRDLPNGGSEEVSISDNEHMKSLFPWWDTGDSSWFGYSANMDNLRGLVAGVKGPAGELPTLGGVPVTSVSYVDRNPPMATPPVMQPASAPVAQPTAPTQRGYTLDDWLNPPVSVMPEGVRPSATPPVVKTAPTANPPVSATRPMTAYELGAPADLQQARKWARSLWATAELTGDKTAKDLATKAVAWANLPAGQRQAILAQEERATRMGDQAQTFRAFDPKLDMDAATNRTLWDDLNKYNKTGKLPDTVTTKGNRKELRDSKGNLIGFSEDKGSKPKGGTVTDNGQTMSFDDWFELHNPATQKRIEAEVAKRLAAA